MRAAWLDFYAKGVFLQRGRCVSRSTNTRATIPPPPPHDECKQIFCEANRTVVNDVVDIKQVASLAQWQKALESHMRMSRSRMKLDIISFNCVMGSLARAEQWERACLFFAEAKRNSLQPNVITFSTLAHAFGSGQKWMLAVHTVDQMSGNGILPNVVTYSSVINACERCSRWEFALHVLLTMRRTSVPPNIISFNSGISACGKGRQWERAFELLQHMGRIVLKPTNTTCNALVSACEKGMQWQLALSSFVEALNTPHGLKTWNGISVPSRGASKHLSDESSTSLDYFCADIITANAVISACEKDQQWHRALSLVDSLSIFRFHPTVITFNVAISACGKGRLWQLALKMFSDIMKQLLEPSLITYNSLLGVCASTSRWRQALALYAEMRDRGYRPSGISLGTLATSLAQRACWERALFYFGEMRHYRLRPSMMAISAIFEHLEQNSYITEELTLLRSLHLLVHHATNAQKQLSHAVLTAASIRWCQEMQDTEVVASLFDDAWRSKTFSNMWLRRRTSYLQPYIKEVCLLQHVFENATMGDATSVCNAVEDFGKHVLGTLAWLKVAGGAKADILRAAVRGAQERGIVMEIGAYCGYSAIRIATAIPGVHVATLEVDPVHVAIARNIIAFAGLAGTIHVWTGHSQSLIPQLAKRYKLNIGTEVPCRMVFMDQQGSRYHDDLALLERCGCVGAGTVVVADNVLKPGAPLYLWHIFTNGCYANRVLRMHEFAMASIDWMVVSVCRADSVADSTAFLPQPSEEIVTLSREADRMRARAMTIGNGVSFKEWASFADRMQEKLLRLDLTMKVEDIASN